MFNPSSGDVRRLKVTPHLRVTQPQALLHGRNASPEGPNPTLPLQMLSHPVQRITPRRTNMRMVEQGFVVHPNMSASRERLTPLATGTSTSVAAELQYKLVCRAVRTE